MQCRAHSQSQVLAWFRSTGPPRRPACCRRQPALLQQGEQQYRSSTDMAGQCGQVSRLGARLSVEQLPGCRPWKATGNAPQRTSQVPAVFGKQCVHLLCSVSSWCPWRWLPDLLVVLNGQIILSNPLCLIVPPQQKLPETNTPTTTHVCAKYLLTFDVWLCQIAPLPNHKRLVFRTQTLTHWTIWRYIYP